MRFCPALRLRLRPVVGAGGFEPPVLDPKSSVLPLDDAPTVRSRWLPVLRRCGIVRVESGGPPAAGRAARPNVCLPPPQASSRPPPERALPPPPHPPLLHRFR